MDAQKVDVGDTVVADEMVILTDKSQKLWVFDVMDYDSRYFVASYASTRRNAQAVRTVFGQVIERTTKPPKVIITDRMGGYIDGIEFAYGADSKHVTSGGLRVEINNK